MTSSIRSGCAGALRQWLRLRSLLGVAAAVAVLVAVARAARRAEPDLCLDRMVAGILTLGVPLLLIHFGTNQSGKGALGSGTDLEVLARHGAHRRAFVLGRLLGHVLLCSGISIAATTAVCLACLDFGGAHLLREISTTAGIGALAVVAYAPLLEAASGLQRHPLGPWIFLFFDNFLGRSAWAMALPFPGSHIRSLLGGNDVSCLSPRASSLALLLLAASATALCTLRRRP